MNPRELEALLDALDLDSTLSEHHAQRATRRWAYRNRAVVVTCPSPGAGASAPMLVAPRNISTGGLAFLHGGFMHRGTRLIVVLRDTSGALRKLTGRVVRCSHVQGRLHEVAVELDAKIDPSDFLRDEGDAPRFNAERVDLDSLQGRVLIVTDFRADQRLIAHHFRGSRLDLWYAQDGSGGIALTDNAVDLVFADWLLPDMPGVQFVQEVRKRGYAGPIVMMTAEDDPAQRAQARANGATELIRKPIDGELLRRAAAEYLVAGGSEPEHTTLLFSSATDPQVLALAEQYVSDLRRCAESLADAVETDDAQKLRRVLAQVAGSAASYGFDSVGRGAAKAMKLLDDTASIGESMAAIQAVITDCRRVAVRSEGQNAA